MFLCELLYSEILLIPWDTAIANWWQGSVDSNCGSHWTIDFLFVGFQYMTVTAP